MYNSFTEESRRIINSAKEEMISLLERYGSAGRMGTLTENGIGELIKLTET